MTEPSIDISLSLSRDEAWDFLRRLVTDDAFRDQLQHDPAGTLAANGVVVSPEAIPDSVTLPSLDEVRELARLYAPDLQLGESGWCPPPGGVFVTCLWLAIGFAAAHRAVQPDGPVAS